MSFKVSDTIPTTRPASEQELRKLAESFATKIERKASA